MTDDHELTLVLESWLREGPHRMPDRVTDVVGSRIAREPQRPGWRFGLDRALRPVGDRFVLVAVVALVVVAILAIAMMAGSPIVVRPGPNPAIAPATSPRADSNGRPATAVPSLPTGPGRIVVEAVDTSMDNELRSIGPDRRELPLLPGFGGHQRTASWRPDGQQIAFAGRPS